MKKSALHSRNVLLSLAAADLVCAALPKTNQVRRGQVAVIITDGSSSLGLAVAHKLEKAGLRFKTALSINLLGALHTNSVAVLRFPAPAFSTGSITGGLW
jgi:hypothetical protein